MSTTSQASQRINTLLDENSFVEIGALVLEVSHLEISLPSMALGELTKSFAFFSSIKVKSVNVGTTFFTFVLYYYSVIMGKFVPR